MQPRGPRDGQLPCPVVVRLELASFDVAGVRFNVGVPLLGKVVKREDRRNWTDWHAGAAVDALDRINEELVDLLEPRAAVLVLCVFLRINAVHWTGIHTGRIFSPDTGLCNDIRHYPNAPFCRISGVGPAYLLHVLRRSRSLLERPPVPDSTFACIAR